MLTLAIITTFPRGFILNILFRPICRSNPRATFADGFKAKGVLREVHPYKRNPGVYRKVSWRSKQSDPDCRPRQLFL